MTLFKHFAHCKSICYSACKRKEFDLTTFDLPEKQLEKIRYGATHLISEQELLKKLSLSYKENKPLRVKAGFDPSRPDLHLGHVVLLNKLRLFQNLGHQVIFLIGDWTACLGDPSGTDKTRPVLSPSEVQKNSETYCRQVFKVLDKEKTEVRFNSSWMDKMSARGLIQLAGQSTVARMLERDDFSKRFKQNKSICIHEFLYPLVQGWDSVVLKADVELGGTDQLFNLLMGRELQKSQGQVPQITLTMPILEGLDGKTKMSKSHNNYIALEDSPTDMFGKTMKLSDELMIHYYKLLTDKPKPYIDQLQEELSSRGRKSRKPTGRQPTNTGHKPTNTSRKPTDKGHKPTDKGRQPTDIGRKPTNTSRKPTDIGHKPTDTGRQPTGTVHPMQAKMDLAYFFVQCFHGIPVAKKAKQNFIKVFSLRQGPPEDIKEYVVSPAQDMGVCRLLCSAGLAPSLSEARRLIEGRAVEKEGQKITDPRLKWDLKVGEAFLLKAGKRRFVKIKVKEGNKMNTDFNTSEERGQK